MIYANFTYYTDTYLGTMSEKDFARCAVRASSFIDYYTMGHAEQNAELDALKMCCCALADNYKVIEMAKELAAKNLNGSLSADVEVKSETVGGYSRTMSGGAENALAALNTTEGAKKLLASTCTEYLAHTGLLYRGGGCKCTPPTL